MPMSPLSPVSPPPSTVWGASPSRRTRPGRSVNQSLPSLSNVIDHGVSSPVATSEVLSRTGPCAVWLTTVVLLPPDGTTPPELSLPSPELQAPATAAAAARTMAGRRWRPIPRMVGPPASAGRAELAEHLLQVVQPGLVGVLDRLLGVLGVRAALRFEATHPLHDGLVAVLADLDGRVVVGHGQRSFGHG